MQYRTVPVNVPLLNGNEEKYLADCIKSGWVSSEGPYVSAFEEKMSKYVGRSHGVAVSSGTAAIDIAVAALGIKDGDEVIMPSHTIISCAAAVVRAGGIPVVIDCDPHTYNMLPEMIEKKITVNTKAIMMVHIYGLPVDVAPIMQIAQSYGLRVIEDAAEAHGLTYNGKQCGSFGDMSIFSFYPNKLITTGEGGMVLTDDPELAERAQYFMNLCFDNTKRFQHTELGWNYRMTNLQAAVGVAQLERINDLINIKKNNGRYYLENLLNLDMVQLPVERTKFAENIFWVFPLVLKTSCSLEVKTVSKLLADKGIGTRPFFWPIHKQEVFLKMGFFKGTVCPNAERIARRGFYIPSGLALSKLDMDYVIHSLKDVLMSNKDL